MIRHIIKAIVTSLDGRKFCKFIYISSGLHTEMPDGLKGHVLGQYTDIELAAFFDNFLLIQLFFIIHYISPVRVLLYIVVLASFCKKFKVTKAVRVSMAAWCEQDMPIDDDGTVCRLINLPLYAVHLLTQF